MARTSDFRVFSLSMSQLERDLLCVAAYKVIDTGRHKKVHTLLRMAGSWGQTMLRPTWRQPLSRATKLGGLVPHAGSLLSRQPSAAVFRHLHELGASVYPACTCPSRLSANRHPRRHEKDRQGFRSLMTMNKTEAHGLLHGSRTRDGAIYTVPLPTRCVNIEAKMDGAST